MPEPVVITVMRSFKAGLVRREAAQQAEMVRRWLQVEDELMPRIDALSLEMDMAAAKGQALTWEKKFELKRYKELLAQIRVEVQGYEDWAAQNISAGQREYAALGIEQAGIAIDTRLAEQGMRLTFSRLPAEAVEYMVGLAGDGSPLFDVLSKRALWPEAVDGLSTKLVQATALGWNPRKTAAMMQEGLADGLQKALEIARTEQLRAFRTANLASYRESGVVDGYRRLAAKDSRTCMPCLILDGKKYTLESEMETHVCDRCTLIPCVIGMADVEYEKGAEWFAKLPADKQQAMMGKGHYDAWKRGEFRLEDMAGTSHSEIWGDSPRVTPLSELTKRQEAAA